MTMSCKCPEFTKDVTEERVSATTGTTVNAKEYQRPYVQFYRRQLMMKRSSPGYIDVVRDATELVLNCTKAKY